MAHGKDKKKVKTTNKNKNKSVVKEEDKKVVGVFVHSSDCLNIDVHLLHPSVKVLLVDLESGHFIQKRNPDQSVTCYEESNVKHIMPLMTQPFVFRHSRTLVPRWEELLLFNEDFQHFASYKEKLGVFFIVQDFVSMNKANNRREDEKGWHDVAWAFLKVSHAIRII